MGRYTYQMIDAQGQRLSGELTASSDEQALAQLSENESAVILQLSSVNTWSIESATQLFQRVSDDARLSFFKQFEFLLRAGLPLFASLQLVMSQVQDAAFRPILQAVRKDLVNGTPLSEAMAQHPKVFSKHYIGMIVVGEGSGKLDHSFAQVVNVIQEEQSLRKKIQKIVHSFALTIALAIAVMIGILTFIFPRFTAIFAKVGMELPLSTRLMIQLSDFVMTHQLELTVAGVFCACLAVFLLKSPMGKHAVDHMLFHIPGVKTIAISVALANFSRTLSSLLNTGVSLVPALEISRDTTESVTMRAMFTRLLQDVREGAKLSDSLSKHPMVPSMMIQLSAAGENSGELGAMMEHIHEYFKTVVDEAMARLTGMMQPLMLIVMGGIVLMMALSIFLPMFNLASGLRR